MDPKLTQPDRREKLAGYAVSAIALLLAVVSGRDYAGGWNDGSRLATVESLVDRHTLAIDDSVFVRVPYDRLGTEKPFPYPIDDPDAWSQGTRDKIRIGEHFYSHKSPVPAVLMAGCYAVWQKLTGATARDRCDEFCYLMTLISSGAAYIVALTTLFYLGGALRLALAERLLLTASLGLATVAPAYSRNVNDHILLLGVALLLTYNLVRLAQAWGERGPAWHRHWPRLIVVGLLSGAGYTIDLAAGPLLLGATFAAVAFRIRGHLAGLAIVALAALPWIVLHQALNYSLGGTLAPVGSVATYFDWPDSPFRRETLTSFWNHASPRGFVVYLAALLIDPQRGFLLHNLPLLLLLPGTVTLGLLKKGSRPNEWPELLALGGWAVGTWWLYGALSVNFSGDCCSIRWFVPLLAPGYVAIAVLARDEVGYRRGLWLLSAAGLPLAAMMWWQGPWLEPDNPSFIPLEIFGVIVWLGWCVWLVYLRRRRQPARPS